MNSHELKPYGRLFACARPPATAVSDEPGANRHRRLGSFSEREMAKIEGIVTGTDRYHNAVDAEA
jgi:hypothetical protein